MIAFSRFKVLTFDCYGTLIDWEAGILDCVSPWLKDIGASVPYNLVLSAFALMQAQHRHARPALLYPEVLRRTWRDIEATFGWPHDPQRAGLFARSVPAWPPFSDTVESLTYLKRFYRLGILSNVDNNSLAGTLERLVVPFDLLVTAEDVDAYKPDPAHFQTAIARLERMGISRDEILHVAQSKHHDIKPGRALGLTTVWVNRRHGKPGSGATIVTEAEPDLTVRSLAEFVAHHRADTSATAKARHRA